MSKDNEDSIDQLKKNISDYVKFIYGDGLENNLQTNKKEKISQPFYLIRSKIVPLIICVCFMVQDCA